MFSRAITPRGKYDKRIDSECNGPENNGDWKGMMILNTCQTPFADSCLQTGVAEPSFANRSRLHRHQDWALRVWILESQIRKTSPAIQISPCALHSVLQRAPTSVAKESLRLSQEKADVGNGRTASSSRTQLSRTDVMEQAAAGGAHAEACIDRPFCAAGTAEICRESVLGGFETRVWLKIDMLACRMCTSARTPLRRTHLALHALQEGEI